MNTKNLQFETSDFYLAVFCLSRGAKICKVIRKNSNRSVFVFDIPVDQGEKLIADFFDDTTVVNVRNFVTNIRTLREHLFSGV